MSVESVWTCGDYARVVLFFPREASGATGIRHSLRPLFSGGPLSEQPGRASRRGNAELCRDVIARSKATKQSILFFVRTMDCFADARNDGCVRDLLLKN
jgi:hypothetical protein